jgi:hypothetical protein
MFENPTEILLPSEQIFYLQEEEKSAKESAQCTGKKL